MADNESLSSELTRIDAAMHKIKNLRPTFFTLDDLDAELVSMTMVRALPTFYSHFASSLQLLDKLDKDTLQLPSLMRRPFALAPARQEQQLSCLLQRFSLSISVTFKCSAFAMHA
ncbi:uncharacterized protein PHACADRAFT_33583 [Phanerochaete carnosa HHB-10118-sp]|uniref:Uncharacterized protein n=1 Tax=Phanerochaete carnosa (strain HHB-10118-sp) TaxID=650164 RepID=K5VDI7_PHACS|nr:uncharacterized protein PHACADRAFT_33583 [Phanerochaete carnosa HHB-10118-sp]EKM49193.1 hypothetical protein PHACADRAFT_33583 [Phanerochaete carnosa HHB-10118-sp]